jgi:hypothetical protein
MPLPELDILGMHHPLDRSPKENQKTNAEKKYHDGGNFGESSTEIRSKKDSDACTVAKPKHWKPLELHSYTCSHRDWGWLLTKLTRAA